MKKLIIIIIILIGIIFKIINDYNEDIMNLKKQVEKLELNNKYLDSIISKMNQKYFDEDI